jgi:imidazole glycerol-phosphate synthase subunit HisH
VIAVVDFGAGNTRSVLRALAAVGAPAALARTSEALGAADRLVLPGVGAAPTAVEALRARGLWEPIRAWANDGRPLLGVCLGAQLLLSGSDEGDAIGLELIGGRCRAFPEVDRGGPRQVPHIGWNTVETRSGHRFDAYFVHGYWTDADRSAVRGWTVVDGFRFPSIVRSGAVTGVQFHPEKSGPAGRALLAAFATGRLDGVPGAVPAWN